MNPHHPILSLLGALALLAQSAGAIAAGNETRVIERGKYLARIGGCNDCHTPGFAESAGNTPTRQWLTGSPVGFQGPWGTTYPANLRLYVQGMSESQWLARAPAHGPAHALVQHARHAGPGSDRPLPLHPRARPGRGGDAERRRPRRNRGHALHRLRAEEPAHAGQACPALSPAPEEPPATAIGAGARRGGGCGRARTGRDSWPARHGTGRLNPD